MNSFEKMRENEKLLTFEKANKRVKYDPETGNFIRIFSRKVSDIGKQIGVSDHKGYVKISIDKVNYRAHRLAWFLMTGKWPENQIDHINGIKSDNRFCNLREATHSQNNANKSKTVKNVSGYKGICKVNSRWRALIKVDGKKIHLGYYDTPEEAHAAYVAKSKELFGEYAKV